MSADSPRHSSGNASRGMIAVPTIVPPQVVSDRSILDSAIGFINEVTLANQPHTDPKDTITWARFETVADISDPRFGDDWELEGNVAPPLLLILGYGLGVQVWAIPANGEAVEVLSWRHGIVSALRVLPTPSSSVAIEENGRADEPTDAFAEKRPLIALVDGSSSSGSQPQFCAVNFISLKTGTQVKAIKFKNPVIDVLANRSSIVITFHERIAVFDARTLEDRLSITTCYPSPGINPNPVALGHRWLAYAEHKLLHSKRSGGGCDGEGVASYTATVLNASKSLVKGLRELGEQVAAGLTGNSASGTSSKSTSFDSGTGPESKQSGVITIIDIKNPFRDFSPTSGVPMSSASSAGTDPIVAHFIAHSEALVAMEFDNSGMLLLTADRRGHDFHVFRIQPNPVGPSLAAVHHLYVLHRGDTSAKVQNISFSLDSRWVAVSTLRGTTHVFPITPYGGPMGVRTHTSLHVVNKLSRFHRSAGLSAEGRSNSPISHSESTTFSLSLQPYHNTTLPPYPRPTVVMPLAQLRQPFALGSPPGSATLAGGKTGPAGQGSGSQRQRLSSLSDDSGKPLSVCAMFAKSRSWLLDPPNVTREAPHRMQRKAVDSLFVMAGHGALIQYDLNTKLASNVAKEKICDDTSIELEVEAKAQWNLGRRKEGSQEIMPPLTMDNWLVKNRNSCMLTDSTRQYDDSDDRGESWLAQVEIVTHAGPHRRLWMGPQFVFKTYNTPSGSNLSHVDIEAVEIGTNSKATTATTKPEHSSPLNMPLTTAGRSSAVPVLIESGSYSSIEQSPKLMDRFRHDHLDSDFSVAHGDSRLKEDLADAMRESPSVSKDSGGRGCETATTGCSNDNIAFYDALADHDEDQEMQDQDCVHNRNASAAALASALPNIYSYDNSSSYESIDCLKKPKASIEKIVNPLGTVTTVTSCLTAEIKTDILDEVVSQLAAEDTVIHENCDESLFRPVVAIFCDEKTRLQQEEEDRKNQELCQPPENIGNKLVVPVIEKEVDDELNKKEKEKNSSKLQRATQSKERDYLAKEQSKFDEWSSLNKKSIIKLPIVEKEPAKVEEQTSKPNEKSEQLRETKEKTPEKKADLKENTRKEKQDAIGSKKIESSNLPKESDKVIKEMSSKAKKSEETDKMQHMPKAKDSTKLLSKVKEDIITSVKKKSNDNAKENESLAADGPEEFHTTTTTGVVKDKATIYGEEKREINPDPMHLPKESAKAATGIKAKKVSNLKEVTPERALSPKPLTKKIGKGSTADESEEEKPMDFIRMTPTKQETITPQKPLTRKEIKKQQQQRAQEEAIKQGEIEKNKKKTEEKDVTEEKRSEESAYTKTYDKAKSESENRNKTAPGNIQAKDIMTKGNINKVQEESKSSIEVSPLPQPLSESDNNTTACVAADKNDDEEPTSSKYLDKELTRRISETQLMEDIKDKNEPPRTAVNIKISAIDKTAISEEIKNTPTLKSQSRITKPAKKETIKSIIKTEKLNVQDLADSLIELQDDEVEAKEIIKPEEKTVIVTTPPLLEAVDIFTAPTTLPKKNKKKGNKSESSSETDEIVQIVKPCSSNSLVSNKTKAKEDDVPALKKKSSTSSDESYTDLADSLLERKDDVLKETMFISFKQIEESRKLQDKKIVKQRKDDNLKEPTKSNESEKDHNKGGQYSNEPLDATLKQQDIKDKENKKSVKDHDKQTKGFSEQKLEKNDLNVEENAKEKITNKTEHRKIVSKQSPADDDNGHEVTVKEEQFENKTKGAVQKKLQESNVVIVEGVSLVKDKLLKTKEKSEVLVPPKESKCEEEIDKFCSKSINQYSDTKSASKESDKNNDVTLKIPTAKVKKCDESGKVKSGALKKTAEKNNEKEKSSVTSNLESSSSEESGKNPSIVLSKSLGSTNDIEEIDSKKAETSKKLAEKKKEYEDSEEEKEIVEENTKHTGSKQKIVSVEKCNDQMIRMSKTKDQEQNRYSQDPNESDRNLEKITCKEIKEIEQDKQTSETETTERKSKESKLDEVKDLQLKTTAAKEKSSQLVKEIVSRNKNDNDKDVKKPDICKNTECKKPVSPKEKGVVDQQPRMHQNKELQKEGVMNRYEKDTPTTKNKDNDVESNLLSTQDSLTPKASASPSPKKNEGKISKVEIPTTELLTTSKSTEKSAFKDSKDELSKTVKKKSEMDLVSAVSTKKPTTASICKQGAKKEDNLKEKPTKLEEGYKIKMIESLPQDSSKKSLDPTTKSAATAMSPPQPIACAWKTLSGAEMIAKNLSKKESRPDDTLFPSLGAIAKTPKTTEKLLPELPTPKEMKEPLGVTKSPSSKKSKSSRAMDDFPILQALEPLPPLPALEPLELLGESKNSNGKDISLINFESPLQENSALDRKITPPPRCFTEQNLVFALCGSLHYENEQRSRATPEKSDASSSNRSSSALDEPSMADYKSLTENDDPYVSLEQSSQDTNTTNTHTTNDKFSSSNNSSGTEEIIIMEEKKITKKQKRKRQQQLLELQKQKDLQMQQRNQHTSELDDEELRPLIAMSESQVENIAERVGNHPLPSLLDDSFSLKPLIAQSNTLTYYTTTDSEGPMPATTSDDNVFIMPSTTTHTQHKIKTKKMEHKFNLIAAIEAATSSSTSSAEESGVEVGGGRSRDNDDPPSLSPSMISAAGGTATASATSTLPIPMSPVVVGASPVAALSSTVGALKKKTKRPYQFRKDKSGSGADTTDGMDKMRNKLNHKKSTTDMNNSTHDSNTTTKTATTSALKQKLLEKKSLSQDPTLPPQQSTETHNSIYEMKQQQYLTNNAMDNCFASPDAANLEAATIVNIDIFDDQLSTSSISNTSRFSCETTPLTTTTPPISLNGVIDTNLMHFSHNTTATVVTKGSAAATSVGGGKNVKDGTTAHSDNNRLSMLSRRHGGGSGGSAEEDDDDDNSSSASGGSL